MNRLFGISKTTEYDKSEDGVDSGSNSDSCTSDSKDERIEEKKQTSLVTNEVCEVKTLTPEEERKLILPCVREFNTSNIHKQTRVLYIRWKITKEDLETHEDTEEHRAKSFSIWTPKRSGVFPFKLRKRIRLFHSTSAEPTDNEFSDNDETYYSDSYDDDDDFMSEKEDSGTPRGYEPNKADGRKQKTNTIPEDVYIEFDGSRCLCTSIRVLTAKNTFPTAVGLRTNASKRMTYFSEITAEEYSIIFSTGSCDIPYNYSILDKHRVLYSHRITNDVRFYGNLTTEKLNVLSEHVVDLGDHRSTLVVPGYHPLTTYLIYEQSVHGIIINHEEVQNMIRRNHTDKEYEISSLKYNECMRNINEIISSLPMTDLNNIEFEIFPVNGKSWRENAYLVRNMDEFEITVAIEIEYYPVWWA